jgi:uncharacterized OsmC-like protein
MGEDRRAVQLSRLARGSYEATNPRGGRLHFGAATEGSEQEFTPVELLLVAIAGCTAIDVDFITTKTSEPTRFEVGMTGNKIRDEQGNRMVDLRLTFDVSFPDDDGGRVAAGKLESAVKASHDRLCTVSRTVEVGTPVQSRPRGEDV